LNTLAYWVECRAKRRRGGPPIGKPINQVLEVDLDNEEVSVPASSIAPGELVMLAKIQSLRQRPCFLIWRTVARFGQIAFNPGNAI